MSFNPFKPLTPEQIAAKDEASKEYLRRRAIIFDVFHTPKGKELLKLMRSSTIDRPFNLDAPRTADGQVAFQTAYTEKKANDRFVRQFITQIEQERTHRAAQTKTKEK